MIDLLQRQGPTAETTPVRAGDPPVRTPRTGVLSGGAPASSVSYFSDTKEAPPAMKSVTRLIDVSGVEEREAASFDRLVALKISVSKIAMHLESAWRSGVFTQLDYLLDPEEWDASDALPDVNSFSTFLRMVVFLGRVKQPSLGANSKGNVVAAWFIGDDRLTIECGPHDKVRWVLSRVHEGARESAAGETTVRRLVDVLAPYDPQHWFAKLAE